MSFISLPDLSSFPSGLVGITRRGSPALSNSNRLSAEVDCHGGVELRAALRAGDVDPFDGGMSALAAGPVDHGRDSCVREQRRVGPEGHADHLGATSMCAHEADDLLVLGDLEGLA